MASVNSRVVGIKAEVLNDLARYCHARILCSKG